LRRRARSPAGSLRSGRLLGSGRTCQELNTSSEPAPAGESTWLPDVDGSAISAPQSHSRGSVAKGSRTSARRDPSAWNCGRRPAPRLIPRPQWRDRSQSDVRSPSWQNLKSGGASVRGSPAGFNHRLRGRGAASRRRWSRSCSRTRPTAVGGQELDGPSARIPSVADPLRGCRQRSLVAKPSRRRVKANENMRPPYRPSDSTTVAWWPLRVRFPGRPYRGQIRRGQTSRGCMRASARLASKTVSAGAHR
jgi:hypothetical protein